MGVERGDVIRSARDSNELDMCECVREGVGCVCWGGGGAVVICI